VGERTVGEEGREGGREGKEGRGGREREEELKRGRKPSAYLFAHVLATTPGLNHEASGFPVDGGHLLLFLLPVCV